MSTCACLGSGWRVVENSFPQQLIPCPECNAVEERARERALARLAALRDELGHLADCTFETFDAERVLTTAVTWIRQPWAVTEQRAALAQAKAVCERYAAEPNGWLFLAGPYGTGKSHLAAAIAHVVAARGQSVAYSSVPELLRFLREGFETHDTDARFTALQRVDLLVLDDLGAEKRSAWVDEQLFILINHRYLRAAPTVITSNVWLSAHEGRIASRIAGMATELVLPVADFRRTGGTQ